MSTRNIISILCLTIAVGVVGFFSGVSYQKSRSTPSKVTEVGQKKGVQYHGIELPAFDDYRLSTSDPILVLEVKKPNTDRGRVLVSRNDQQGGIFDWALKEYPGATTFASTVNAELPAVTLYVHEDDFPGELSSTKTIFDSGGWRYIIETQGWTLQEHMALLRDIKELPSVE